MATLPKACPLRSLPFRTFPMPENRTERLWKLIGHPHMDDYVSPSSDWLFAPTETYFPVLKCPVAFTLHDVQAFEPNLPWSQSWQHRWFRYKWGHWVRRAIAKARIVFTISEFSRQRIVQLLNVPDSKIINVGCGVESPFFEIASVEPSLLQRPVSNPYILMVGGLRQKKGGDYYLALARYLLQQCSPVQIVIAGEFDEAYVQAAKEFPNIKLLGPVPDEALPKLMRSALCLLFLSLYEGFGIPPLEAMAAGIPVIVSNRASLPEVVGNAAFVVEPNTTEAIADLIANLESNTALRNSYIQKGQLHASKYLWPNCVDKIIEALKCFA